MRCLYCHNPDTQRVNGGDEVEAADIIADVCKNRAFYTRGGLTVTGGEPLLQIDFLIELFSLAKKEGFHTCIDTSGITYRPDHLPYIRKLDRLMSVTDLVLLDIKQIDPIRHRELTGHDNAPVLAFARYLEEKKIPVWIRHVVVAGYTDREDDLAALGRFIGTLSNLQALDVLPYHTLGVEKYHTLGIPYPLEGLPPLPHSEAIRAKKIILDAARSVRALPV